MAETKMVGFVFVEGFADWEYGFLSASAREWFGVNTVSLAPAGAEVRSLSGFRLTPDRSTAPEENTDLDAIAVIGSDIWATPQAPDLTALLRAIAQRCGVVGGICGATLALARAGLFNGVNHTSNGREWITERAPQYAGASRYQDVPDAVADKRIVSAPGTAPGTFAAAFRETLFPTERERIGEMRALFAREYT